MNGKVATTSVAHKIIVGLSGLLLCGFLVAHLAGNFLIYLPADGYKAYNDYAHGLHSLSVLPVIEIGLLAVFLGHVVYAFVTWSRNRGARPQKYAVQRSKRGATGVSAQNVMQWSGIVVLAFILLHLVDMRFGLRFPERPGVTPAERALADYDAGLATLERRRLALDAAHAGLDHASARHAAGDIALAELLAAQRTVSEAEIAAARAHTGAAVQGVSLYKALGGGWDAPAPAPQSSNPIPIAIPGATAVALPTLSKP